MASSKQSTIDPNWKVLTFTRTDSAYPEDLFKVFGVGFADLNSSLIIIDGETITDPDQVLAIEAHEIAHGRLDHATREISDIDKEREADWLANRILTEMNLVTPARLISERYWLLYDEQLSSLDERMVATLGEINNKKR